MIVPIGGKSLQPKRTDLESVVLFQLGTHVLSFPKYNPALFVLLIEESGLGRAIQRYSLLGYNPNREISRVAFARKKILRDVNAGKGYWSLHLIRYAHR